MWLNKIYHHIYYVLNYFLNYCTPIYSLKRLSNIHTLAKFQKLILLKQLKRAEVETSSLYKFYTACIKSVAEYPCQVFHSSLPNYLSSEIESVQKRALRHISTAINQAKLETLYERREKLCIKLFSSIEANNDHKLKELMPPKKSVIYLSIYLTIYLSVYLSNVKHILKHQVIWSKIWYKMARGLLTFVRAFNSHAFIVFLYRHIVLYFRRYVVYECYH